jgi:transposase
VVVESASAAAWRKVVEDERGAAGSCGSHAEPGIDSERGTDRAGGGAYRGGQRGERGDVAGGVRGAAWKERLMIPAGVEIFVAVTPIDLRWGFDRLAGVANEQLGRNARSGALLVFFGKRKSAVKILFFDGSGMCLFYKRLDSRTFRVPQALRPDSTSIELSERELDDLLDGIDVDPEARPRRGRVH